MKKYILILAAFISLSSEICFTQIFNPVKWSYKIEEENNDKADLFFNAAIDEGWHLYGLNIPENGPIATSIIFNDSNTFELIGKPVSVTKPEIKYDPYFGLELELFSNEVIIKQSIKKISNKDFKITGFIEFMSCDDQRCLPPKEFEFSFSLKGIKDDLKVSDDISGKTDMGEIVYDKEELTVMNASDKSDEYDMESGQSDTLSVKQEVKIEDTYEAMPDRKSLIGILLISILAGFGALITPCVYPMIPMTVSFFMRGEKSRSRAVSEALVFGLSIVFIYTSIGVLVAVFKNPNAVNSINTHWIPNLLFFLIFIILSASFFGMFEIILPGGLTTRIDKQADKGGYLGAFFMALAMALISFSCTGPIVASLLIKASQGEVFEPVIGMFGFSLIFAIPFTLLAIFPSWLKNLPKSGGWLNSVKVFLAFIMLAFSFYFIGKIEQAYHLNILSRDLFITIWIVIFVLLGFYLLGKIKFAHDSDIKHISVLRLLFSVFAFSFAVYLIPGLFGAELRGISTLIPPIENQKFDLTQNKAFSKESIETSELTSGSILCGTPEYSDFLYLPHGLEGYYDYEEALACAIQRNKPLLIDFVGHYCSSCKKMYNKVWSDPEVLKILKYDFIIVALYTDDKTKLSKEKWVTSQLDGKVKNTIGKINADLQVTKFKSNALPLYAIIDHNENLLTQSLYTYNPSTDKFVKWLKEGKANFLINN
jgi:thiol:disulfide interchange protein DsbD